MRQKGSCRNREVMPDDMSGKDEGQSISDPEDPSALTQDLEELLKLWAVDGEDGGTDLPKDAFRGMREESPRETEGAEQVSEANETGKLRDEGPQLSVTGRRAKSRKDLQTMARRNLYRRVLAVSTLRHISIFPGSNRSER